MALRFDLDFLGDEVWLRSHGYIRGYGGLQSFVRVDDLPLERWSEYCERLRGGWLPSVREFAGWHPLDQQRFEAEYVYDLTSKERELYYERGTSFFSRPLDAIAFYVHYLNPLDISKGLHSFEVYCDNYLAASAEYDEGLGDFVCWSHLPLDWLKDFDLLRFVVNDATAYVSFCKRVVFDRVSGQITEEFERCLRDGRLDLNTLRILSQEGY